MLAMNIVQSGEWHIITFSEDEATMVFAAP